MTSVSHVEIIKKKNIWLPSKSPMTKEPSSTQDSTSADTWYNGPPKRKRKRKQREAVKALKMGFKKKIYYLI